jgi:polysaccharide pyruvyl transferase WcaK-like protein
MLNRSKSPGERWRQMTRILIAENAPTLNKGEMAIIAGMRESLRELGPVELSMFSFCPEIDQPRYGETVRIVDVKKSWWMIRTREDGVSLLKSIFVMILHLLFLAFNAVLGRRVLRLFRGEIWEKYLDSDLIVMGHDSSFGIGGDPENPLFYFLYLPFFAKVLRKRIMFFGGSVPQPPKRLNGLLSKAFKSAISKIDVVTLRDETSISNLREIGIEDERIVVTADPAFLLEPAAADEVDRIWQAEGLDGTPNALIGMTISRARATVAFPELNNPSLSYDKHVGIVADCVDQITAKLDALVVFVPHTIGLGDDLDDRIVAADIRARCQNKDRVKVITTEYGPAQLKGMIGRFDLFVGERLHSVVAAMTMGVPAIGISRSSDQRLGMVRMLGGEEAVCFLDGLDCDTLFHRVDELWSQRRETSRRLCSRTEAVKERARLNGVKLMELLGLARCAPMSSWSEDPSRIGTANE